MSTYGLGPKAQSDLTEIFDYTVDFWGEDQALRYHTDLSTCFELIARNHAIGRSCEQIRHGLRRIECGSHIVFYRAAGKEVQIVRILHQNRLPERSYFID